MKPTTITNNDARKFPVVDYHYQTVSVEKFTGHCAKTSSKSLRDISRDYFDREANHDFLSDAAVFGTLIATAAVPIVIGLNAVIQLCRALPLF
jgi:hypothetical protein